MAIVKIALIIIGALAALMGLIWIGQGTGIFPYPASSFMINQSPWILRGAVLMGIGLAVIWGARRFLK